MKSTVLLGIMCGVIGCANSAYGMESNLLQVIGVHSYGNESVISTYPQKDLRNLVPSQEIQAMDTRVTTIDVNNLLETSEIYLDDILHINEEKKDSVSVYFDVVGPQGGRAQLVLHATKQFLNNIREGQYTQGTVFPRELSRNSLCRIMDIRYDEKAQRASISYSGPKTKSNTVELKLSSVTVQKMIAECVKAINYCKVYGQLETEFAAEVLQASFVAALYSGFAK